VIPVSISDRPPTRKEFDYSSLDDESRHFIQQQTGEIRGLMKRTAQGIVEIGQRLIEVKTRLEHGRFGDWLKAEFDWSWDTAGRFINVATRFSTVPQVAEFAPTALYILAASSTPKPAREEAIARAEAGEYITYTTAKEIKKKYTSSTTTVKSKPEPETEPAPAISPPTTPTPTPPSSPVPSSRLEIVGIRPSSQPSTAKAEVTAGATDLQPPQSVTPETPGVWWQLGGRHLLFRGDPNSDEFLARLPEQVQLLLAFPPTNNWQTRVVADVRLILGDYLPIFQNSELLDGVLETLILSNSSIRDTVVVCFLPSPDILSIINRFERRGVIAEPNLRRCNAVMADWKRAGLKVERLLDNQ